MNAHFEGRADEILSAMREAVGIQAEGYAKKGAKVDTGRLRNSISHKVDARGQEVCIGTNIKHGIYQELIMVVPK